VINVLVVVARLLGVLVLLVLRLLLRLCVGVGKHSTLLQLQLLLLLLLLLLLHVQLVLLLLLLLLQLLLMLQRIHRGNRDKVGCKRFAVRTAQCICTVEQSRTALVSTLVDRHT
jgi:hypothetical protein